MNKLKTAILSALTIIAIFAVCDYSNIKTVKYCHGTYDLCDEKTYNQCFECEIDVTEEYCMGPEFIYFRVGDKNYVESFEMIKSECLGDVY